MRELTSKEVEAVSGGFNPLLILGIPGAVFMWGYRTGKELADRDNRTMPEASLGNSALDPAGLLS